MGLTTTATQPNYFSQGTLEQRIFDCFDKAPESFVTDLRAIKCWFTCRTVGCILHLKNRLKKLEHNPPSTTKTNLSTLGLMVSVAILVAAIYTIALPKNWHTKHESFVNSEGNLDWRKISWMKRTAGIVAGLGIPLGIVGTTIGANQAFGLEKIWTKTIYKEHVRALKNRLTDKGIYSVHSIKAALEREGYQQSAEFIDTLHQVITDKNFP